MVKITFQSVAGQKVEKDQDKSEILIPHPVVSELHGPVRGPPGRPAGPPAPACLWSGGGGGVLAGAIAIWTQTKPAER